MDEKSLTALMTECGFSKKQISSVRKVSEHYKKSIFDIVCELARRFPIFLGTYIFILLFIIMGNIHEWLHESEGRYASLVISAIIFLFCLFIGNMFTPMIISYRSQSVMKKIRKTHS